MKKYAAIVLVIILLMTFVSCNKSNAPENVVEELDIIENAEVAEESEESNIVENDKQQEDTIEVSTDWLGGYTATIPWSEDFQGLYAYFIDIFQEEDTLKAKLILRDNYEDTLKVDIDCEIVTRDDEPDSIYLRARTVHTLDSSLENIEENDTLMKLTPEQYGYINTEWLVNLPQDGSTEFKTALELIKEETEYAARTTTPRRTDAELLETARKYLAIEEDDTGNILVPYTYALLGLDFNQDTLHRVIAIERFEEVHSLVSDESDVSDLLEEHFSADVVEETMSTYFGITDSSYLRDHLEYDPALGYKHSFGGYGGGGIEYAIVTSIDESNGRTIMNYDIEYIFMGDPDGYYATGSGTMEIETHEDGTFTYVSNAKTRDYPVNPDIFE